MCDVHSRIWVFPKNLCTRKHKGVCVEADQWPVTENKEKVLRNGANKSTVAHLWYTALCTLLNSDLGASWAWSSMLVFNSFEWIFLPDFIKLQLPPHPSTEFPKLSYCWIGKLFSFACFKLSTWPFNLISLLLSRYDSHSPFLCYSEFYHISTTISVALFAGQRYFIHLDVLLKESFPWLTILVTLFCTFSNPTK